jgi:hypothetical protein
MFDLKRTFHHAREIADPKAQLLTSSHVALPYMKYSWTMHTHDVSVSAKVAKERRKRKETFHSTQSK